MNCPILRSAAPALAATLLLLAATGCGPAAPPAAATPTVGVAFETLQTEYWVASLAAIRAECARRDLAMLEAVANGDANRQLQQVRNFITRQVSGIIVVPKDGKTVIPMIRAANSAGIPIVCYNRPPDKSDARAVTVVADNYAITKATVNYLARKARASGRKHKALILIGDLGDINAIGRRDGFEDAVKDYPDCLEVVARVPTEWNNEKALAGVANALQAHPDISFIFTSSDLHLPALASALKNANKYHPAGAPGHVLLAGFDGDATAYQMLVDGYLDADGVQNAYFESEAAVQAILDLRAGKPVPDVIPDPGFVIHQDNLKDMAPKMWGAQVKSASSARP
jgi:inositol transport system substrate-binding protein